MRKIEHYVTGNWTTGSEEGIPIYDAVTGEAFASIAIEGLNIPDILQYGRTKGGETLRQMTFQERGNMLKKLALHLTKKKDAFYELSFRTGATKIDSWIDIEGGFGNLFANASLRKLFPNQAFDVEGDPIDLSRGGRFMAHHIMVPKKGVAVHINAFNFPVWGMLEKCAVNWMAGMRSITGTFILLFGRGSSKRNYKFGDFTRRCIANYQWHRKNNISNSTISRRGNLYRFC